MDDSEAQNDAAAGGEVVSNETARAGRRLEEVMARSRSDVGVGELLQAIEAVHNSLRIDSAYLSEAVSAEQRLVGELKRRNKVLSETAADAARQATLKEHQAGRLQSRILELEKAMEEQEIRAEADQLMALTERDTAVEDLSTHIRTLESENGRLADELAELRQKVRPLDVATERHADPAVTLVVDGDQMVLRGWGGAPLGTGRTRVISSLNRLAADRDAPVEVVFGSPEGLNLNELDDAPIRVRVISNGVPMQSALAALREQYETQTEVAVITDHPDVQRSVPIGRLIEMLGMPSSTGRGNPVTSIAINR